MATIKPGALLNVGEDVCHNSDTVATNTARWNLEKTSSIKVVDRLPKLVVGWNSQPHLLPLLLATCV